MAAGVAEVHCEQARVPLVVKRVYGKALLHLLR